MIYSLKNLTGIGREERAAFARERVRTTESLLQQCADRAGRRRLARATGFSESQLLRWTNMADLMRVSGVGEEYCELLEAAGVDTVKELSRRRPANLCARLAALNAERRVVRRTPSTAQVESWVAQAARLESTITH